MQKKIKGTNDILPGFLGEGVFVSEFWQRIEEEILNTAGLYSYREIRTPIFENTEVFVKGIGDTSDIVTKEMYTFSDRSDRSMTLRPEGTASIVRSYIENSIMKKEPISRFFYGGPMFRAERPQKGRYRQFHQFGVECIGGDSAKYDIEVISLFWTLLSRLGLKDMELVINSVGNTQSRAVYLDKLKIYFKDKLDGMCKECKDRYEKNILRMLDCKVDGCQDILNAVPSIIDSLSQESKDFFNGVKDGLENLGIPYIISNRLVRGLDYYTETAFEIIHGGIGAQSTIVGGGRYNDLILQSGGNSVPAVGAAFGIERLLLALLDEGVISPVDNEPFYFIVLLDKEMEADAQKILYDLRLEGIPSTESDGSRNMAKQLKSADKSGARFAVFIGGDEWTASSVMVKDLKTSKQNEISFKDSYPLSVLTSFYNKLGVK
ncbi:MAG: histidine--tRNA ligase [Spirochaetes bacterium]|nr:histidine--tRNA ligase [Spirochaetota bacterium]